MNKVSKMDLKLYPSTEVWSAYINGEYVPGGNLETAERVYELHMGSGRVAPWHHVPGGCKNCINLYLGSLYFRLKPQVDVFADLKLAGFTDAEIDAMYRLYSGEIVLADPPTFEVSFGCGSYIVLRIDGKVVHGDDMTKANRVSVAIGTKADNERTAGEARRFLATMWASQELRKDDMPSPESIVGGLVNKGFRRDEALHIAKVAALSLLGASFFANMVTLL